MYKTTTTINFSKQQSYLPNFNSILYFEMCVLPLFSPFPILSKSAALNLTFGVGCNLHTHISCSVLPSVLLLGVLLSFRLEEGTFDTYDTVPTTNCGFALSNRTTRCKIVPGSNSKNAICSKIKIANAGAM